MRNKLKLSLTVIVLVVILYCIYLLLAYHFRSQDFIEQKMKAHINADINQEYIAEVKGLIYEAKHEGRSVFRISADRLVVRKKKVAHFSIGILCEVILENAVVRLNEMPSGENGTDGSFPMTQTFDEIFGTLSLPFNPFGKLSSVELSPARVELCDNGSVLAQISASSARVRFKQKDILFKKKVTLSSSSRTLYTEQLSLCPKENQVSTDHRFLLKTPDGEWAGNRLTTDVYLKTVHLEDMLRAHDYP